MKIIAVIEDTGERRKALPGENWTSLYQLAALNVTHSVYTHEQSSNDEQVILRVTEAAPDDLSPLLSLKERIELIHLRKFAKQVNEAALSVSAHDVNTPEELLRDAEQLATRMQCAGIVLGEALKEFKEMRGKPMPELGDYTVKVATGPAYETVLESKLREGDAV